MYRFALLILFAVSLNSFAQGAAVPSCSKLIQGVKIWEIESNSGKIFKKHKIRPMEDWEPNGNLFRLIVIVGKLPSDVKSPVLEMEYVPNSGGKTVTATFKKLLPYSRNPKLPQFDDFDARDFFVFDGLGKYTARLKNGDKTICEETHNYGAAE